MSYEIKANITFVVMVIGTLVLFSLPIFLMGAGI